MKHLHSILFSLSLTCAHAEGPNLTLHWTFDHETGRGEVDASGHGHHGVLAGYPPHHPVTRRVSDKGVFHGAAEIMSRSSVRTFDPVPFGETWTLCFWTKQTILQHGNGFVRLEGLSSGTDPAATKFLFELKGMPRFEVTRPHPGEWEHLAIVVAPGKARLFLDGKQVDHWEKDGWRFPTRESKLFFGAPDWHRQYRGFMDEIRLYDGPLTDEMIQRLAKPDSYPQLNYPAVVDPGPAVTLWLPDTTASLEARIEDDGNGKTPVTHEWKVKSTPEGDDATLSDPSSLKTSITLSGEGHYAFELTVKDGPFTIAKEVNAVVFPPHKERKGKPYTGPHHKPENGYTEDFVKKYFPPFPPLPIQEKGFAKERFPAPPPPYVHPRIFFNAEELPELRRRLKTTRAGQARMRRLRNSLGHVPWVRGPHELPPEIRNLVSERPEEEEVYTGPLPSISDSGAGMLPADSQAGSLRHEGIEADLDEATDLTKKEEPKQEEEEPKKHRLDFYRPFTVVTAEGDFSSDLGQAATMVNEAFRCLFDADTAGARKVIEVLVKSAQTQLRWLAQDFVRAKTNWQLAAHDIPGRYGNALLYDFLYPWMTEDERAIVREALSEAVGGRWCIGMYSYPCGSTATGNWVVWLTGDLMINALAIEGEDGFDQGVYEECVRVWKCLLNVGFFPRSGAPMEAIGKGLMSAEKLAPITRRGVPLLASQTAYRYASQFLLHTMLPQGGEFIRDDLHGGIGSAVSSDICAIKHAFPNDPVIDFVYRNAMGDRFPGGVHGTTYSAAIGPSPLFHVDDWDGPKDWDEHLKQTLKATGGLPLSYFAKDTGVMVTRSEWSRDALHLYFRPRRLGGHRAPNRGTFVVSALGRTWNHHSTMGERAGSQGYSLVTIDGQSNSADNARAVNYQDTKLATFAAADLKRTYARGGRGDITYNDTLLEPLPYAWADLPGYKMPQWYDGARPNVPMEKWEEHAPKAAAQTGKRPMKHAFRTAGIVRGKHPYLLIIDDIQQDDQPRHYDWLFRMSGGTRVHKIEHRYFREVKMPGHGDYWLPPKPHGGDIVLCPKDAAAEPAKGTPMLLIRVLERRDERKINPLAYVQSDSSTMHGARNQPCLIVPAYTKAPKFKVLLYPFRYQVDTLPETGWDKDNTALVIKWKGVSDMYTFKTLEDGRTGFEMERLGSAVGPGAGAQKFRFFKHDDESLLDELEGPEDDEDEGGLPDF